MSPPLARWSQKDYLPLARIHTPGIEPGPAAWKAVVLPLHHVCLLREPSMSCHDAAMQQEKYEA